MIVAVFERLAFLNGFFSSSPFWPLGSSSSSLDRLLLLL